MTNAIDHNAAARRSIIDADDMNTLMLIDITARSLAYLLRELADRDPDRAKRHHYIETARRLDELRAPILHRLALTEDAP